MDALNSLPPKLLQRVAATMRCRKNGPRTNESFTYWIEQIGAPQTEAFLTYLASERISASPLDRI